MFDETLAPDGNVAEALQLHGSEFIRRIKTDSKPIIEFRCACGNVVQKSSRALGMSPGSGRCADCSIMGKSPLSQQYRATIETKAVESGATDVQCDWLNAHSSLYFTCKCGAPHKASMRKALKSPRPLQCTSCQSVFRKSLVGPLSHSWNDDWDEEARETRRRDKQVRASWYKRVFAKYGKVCVITGASANVSAHHLYSWAAYPDLRNNIDNGVPLDSDLHMEFHDICGGRRAPTVEAQFADFYVLRTGKIWQTRLEVPNAGGL